MSRMTRPGDNSNCRDLLRWCLNVWAPLEFHLWTLQLACMFIALWQFWRMGGTSPAACLQAEHDGLNVHCEELEARDTWGYVRIIPMSNSKIARRLHVGSKEVMAGNLFFQPRSILDRFPLPLQATSAHRLWIYSMDRLRPVLVVRPLGLGNSDDFGLAIQHFLSAAWTGQRSALVVLLHGSFGSVSNFCFWATNGFRFCTFMFGLRWFDSFPRLFQPLP